MITVTAKREGNSHRFSCWIDGRQVTVPDSAYQLSIARALASFVRDDPTIHFRDEAARLIRAVHLSHLMKQAEAAAAGMFSRAPARPQPVTDRAHFALSVECTTRPVE